jgi:hypothetical protein
VNHVSLYRSDFHAWARDQAERLRRLAELRPNAGVDFENLIEEVESMGNEQEHAVDSALTRIIEHLLKLQVSPAVEPRPGWRLTVRNQRRDLAKRLRRNPSLAARLDDFLPGAWTDGRALAVGALGDFGEADSAAGIPADCPYSLDQLRDPDWWPASVHGL